MHVYNIKEYRKLTIGIDHDLISECLCVFISLYILQIPFQTFPTPDLHLCIRVILRFL